MCRLFLTAALEALPLTVRASALPLTIFSAASAPLVGGSAVASAICLPGRLAITRILRKWASTGSYAQARAKRWREERLAGPISEDGVASSTTCPKRAALSYADHRVGPWRTFACDLPIGSIEGDVRRQQSNGGERR